MIRKEMKGERMNMNMNMMIQMDKTKILKRIIINELMIPRDFFQVNCNKYDISADFILFCYIPLRSREREKRKGKKREREKREREKREERRYG